MPHEGYAYPVMNNGPGFHSDMPVSELTERDTRAIEASDVSSTPPVAETADGVTITKTSRPSIGPSLRAGAREKLDSQGDRARGRRTMAQILGRGCARKQETFSPTSFAILSSIFSDTQPQQWQGVGSHSGANKGIHTPFFETVAAPDLFLMLNLVARSAEMND